MCQPCADHANAEADAKQDAGSWDGVHIHPHCPAGSVEEGPGWAVLASAEVLPSTLGGDEDNRLELGVLAAHVVAPWLRSRLAARAPVVDVILLHGLNVGAQLGGVGHRLVGEPPCPKRETCGLGSGWVDQL